MKVEDTSKNDEPTSIIHRGSTILSNRLLERGRLPLNQKEGPALKKQYIAEYIEARRQVKIMVKQDQRNKKLTKYC